MASSESTPLDPRHLSQGWEIPTVSYSDQPYVVIADDGAWVCTLTTGSGKEGEPGQHVVVLRSTDEGRTWEDPVALEAPDGVEASYAVILKGPNGRLFVFYNHNTDNVREIPATVTPYFPDGKCRRVDSLGYFVFKYSDDHGKTWSADRIPIPQRLFEIDRENDFGGKLLYFWNVGKAFSHEGAAFVPLHKVGKMGFGFFERSEGVLLRSSDLFEVEDPADAQWETLPEGEVGIRAPEGGNTVGEEHSFTVLSDGSFYTIFRTIAGHPAHAISRDGGRSWTPSRFLEYADGRRIKNPRAANFVWKCANGKYLYWFHNHGGRHLAAHPDVRGVAYNDRNPVWICGGVEVDGEGGPTIAWSQPEILLYDDDPYIRMSYPDMLESKGVTYFTETQKDVARTHAVDRTLLEGMWDSLGGGAAALPAGLLAASRRNSASMAMPELPAFLERDYARLDHGTRDLRAGLSLEVHFHGGVLEPGTILFDSRDSQGRGMVLKVSDGGGLAFLGSDGMTRAYLDGDPRLLMTGAVNVATVILDGGPKVLLFVVNGKVDDGGDFRQFGWGRYDRNLRHLCGASQALLGRGLTGCRVYGRALRVAEALRSQTIPI